MTCQTEHKSDPKSDKNNDDVKMKNKMKKTKKSENIQEGWGKNMDNVSSFDDQQKHPETAEEAKGTASTKSRKTFISGVEVVSNSVIVFKGMPVIYDRIC